MSKAVVAPIEVRHSGIHGVGVYATDDIAAGDLIGRYAGRRHTPRQVGQRKWDSSLIYLFSLSDGSVIDGADGGNATRHLNHSCAPNCQALEVQGKRSMWIEIEALVDIASGDELLIDYALEDVEGGPQDFPCRCGADRCRGTLVAAATSTSS